MPVTYDIVNPAGDPIGEIEMRPYFQWDGGSPSEIQSRLWTCDGLTAKARIGGSLLLDTYGLICDLDHMQLLATAFEYGLSREGVDRAALLVAQLMCAGFLHMHPWGCAVNMMGRCAACPGGEMRMQAAATFYKWWTTSAPGSA